jgi:hypothetical protein
MNTVYDQVIPATGEHSYGAVNIENEVPATKENKGSYDEVQVCAVCGDVKRVTKYTDALGVTITVDKNDLGSVEGLKEGGKYAYNEAFSLTATPVQGAAFSGWEINGKVVSTDTTYTGTALYDMTITPVFVDKASEKITVTFYDKYGNIVEQYKDVDPSVYQAKVAAEYDNIKGTDYPSWKFTGWDKEKDAILALNTSATIWATYEQQTTASYAVTSPVPVQVPDGVSQDAIPYDTKVTVSDENAKAWKVGNEIVAYGTEYSFYVGANVAVEPVYVLDAEPEASVIIVGKNLLAGSNYKFNILATRTVPEGYELVDYGFIYGKDLTDDDLDLDKVGKKGSKETSGEIKAVHGYTKNTESNEFALNYGVKAQDPFKAKAFVIVSKDGNTEIKFSDILTETYGK